MVTPLLSWLLLLSTRASALSLSRDSEESDNLFNSSSDDQGAGTSWSFSSSSGGPIHNTVSFTPSRTAGGCAYGGVHAFKFTVIGQNTWKECALEASKRGAMMVPGYYSSPVGWYGHRNGNNAMTGVWNKYQTMPITSKTNCVLGYGYQNTRRDARLSSSRIYDGFEWTYQDYGAKYFSECIKLAGDAGASIITPYTIGLTGENYWVHSVHMCNTEEWITSNGNGMGYTSGGRSARMTADKKCMVGYVACVGSCTTTTTTTTQPCGSEGIEGNGASYRGCQTQTKSGKVCQMWSSQTPHKHTTTPNLLPDKDLYNNFCRNPNHEETIWCYTMDPKTRFEYCAPIPTTTTTTTSPPPAEWVLGAEGENCLVVCGVGNCWESQDWGSHWPRDEESFRSTLQEMDHKDCASIEPGDWAVNPAQYGDYGNACYWSNAGASSQHRCAESGPGVSRFCPCIIAVSTTPTTTLKATTTTEQATTTTEQVTTTTERVVPTTTQAPDGDSPPSRRRRRGSRRRRRKGSRRRKATRRRRRKTIIE